VPDLPPVAGAPPSPVAAAPPVEEGWPIAGDPPVAGVPPRAGEPPLLTVCPAEPPASSDPVLPVDCAQDQANGRLANRTAATIPVFCMSTSG
jgi:hypothetical protein